MDRFVAGEGPREARRGADEGAFRFGIAEWLVPYITTAHARCTPFLIKAFISFPERVAYLSAQGPSVSTLDLDAFQLRF